MAGVRGRAAMFSPQSRCLSGRLRICAGGLLCLRSNSLGYLFTAFDLNFDALSTAKERY
jgi:hypothetical protein